MPDLSIIIVNYNTPELTLKCIDSIRNSNIRISYEIIIVDNLSMDDSRERLSRLPNVKYVQSNENVGFGRGNNLGIKNSDGKYILLINSDLIVNQCSIQICFDQLVLASDIGVLSCKILNFDNSEQNYTSTVASFRKILERNLLLDKLGLTKFKYSTEAVMGSFMMFDKSKFLEIGQFDPQFFMYSEEIELCYRFTKNNYRIVLVSEASVYHINGGSTSDRTWAHRQSYLSSALLFYKVKGILGFLLYNFLILFNFLTNFFFGWFLDNNYRSSLKTDMKNYFAVFKLIVIIPFKYSRGLSKKDNMLKYIYE